MTVGLQNPAEHTSVERWKVSDLLDALSFEPNKDNKIAIPQFQRQIVWTKDRKHDFIDSVKLGYPVGALLLYSNGHNGRHKLYSLVDGLQRSTTLKHYNARKFEYFKNADIPDIVAQTISTHFADAPMDVSRSLVLQWLKGRSGFEEVEHYSAYDLFAFLKDELESSVAIPPPELLEVLSRFLQAKRLEADLSNRELPVMIFIGDRAKLPEIFNRMNSKGTPLNKYEIYAATWLDSKITVNDNNILNAVVEKYREIIEQAQLEVENFDQEDFRAPADVTLFECLFGFGKTLGRRFPFLFRVKNDDPGETDSIGFTLATTCVGKKLSEMDTLPQKITSATFSEFTKRMLAAIDFVDKALKGVFDVKAHNLVAQGNYHTQNQIASLIGFVYRRMFIDEGILRENWSLSGPERSDWATTKGVLQESIKDHYLYDIMREAWRGSGDSRLAANVFDSNEYAERITTERWDGVYAEWFTEQLKSRLNERRAIPSDIQLFIKYLYADRISVLANSQEEYELEHLIPISRLKKAIAADSLPGLPMNCIGNIALLPKEINRNKGDLTLTEYFRKQVDLGELSESEASAKLGKYLQFAFVKSSEDLNIPQREDETGHPTEAWYRSFVANRFQYLSEQFASIYRSPTSSG